LAFVAAFFCFMVADEAAMKFNNNGAADMLSAYFNNSFPASKTLTVHLFCTSTSVTDSVTPASFTECTGGGYSSVTLTNGSWTVSQSSSIYQAAYAAQTITFTGALTTNGTVYGYYVTNAQAAGGCTAAGVPSACCTGSGAGSGCPDVVTAETFGQSFTPANNGDNIVLTPIIQLSWGTPAS
jgi:hypothetical protein